MKRSAPIPRRTPLPRSSQPIARGGPIARTRQIRPKKRTASEFARIYGSKARVRWVKAQPCVCCETVTGRNHNHHVITGGMGRKADALTIVSLCPSCHHLLHTGELGRSREWWLDMAHRTAAAWHQHQADPNPRTDTDFEDAA